LEHVRSFAEQGGRAEGLFGHCTQQIGGKLQASKRTEGEKTAAIGREVEADQAIGVGECRGD